MAGDYKFVPDGWVIMPARATQQMVNAAADLPPLYEQRKKRLGDILRDEYEAMVANRPIPVKPDNEDQP